MPVYEPSFCQQKDWAQLRHRYSQCNQVMRAVLAEARESAGLSQRQLSGRLKRPSNYAHLVEIGERSMSVCEFIEYANAVSADPDVLFRRLLQLLKHMR